MMESDSRYDAYTLEDFVQDKDFQGWVNNPDSLSDRQWKHFLVQHPGKETLIDNACRIVRALHLEEPSVSEDEYKYSMNQLLGYMERKSARRAKWHSFDWRNVAAILILPLMVLSIYLYMDRMTGKYTGQTIQYITAEGQKSKVILGDGTLVWINSGSTLTLSTDKNQQRKVMLSGEAYFEVSKNHQVPFLVQTRHYTIKVYGTQFNVRSYEYQRESETILKEGAVSIITPLKEEIKIYPGQRFLFPGEGPYSLTRVDPAIYISWKDNELKINNEKLQNLLVRMEHWYGVKIEVEKYEKVKDLKYTLTIKTESLREMLDLMNYVTPLSYTINGEKVHIKYKLN
jgi:ferric-dicitrate binding protein FerR (iron transport regulator)